MKAHNNRFPKQTTSPGSRQPSAPQQSRKKKKNKVPKKKGSPTQKKQTSAAEQAGRVRTGQGTKASKPSSSIKSTTSKSEAIDQIGSFIQRTINEFHPNKTIDPQSFPLIKTQIDSKWRSQMSRLEHALNISSPNAAKFPEVLKVIQALTSENGAPVIVRQSDPNKFADSKSVIICIEEVHNDSQQRDVNVKMLGKIYNQDRIPIHGFLHEGATSSSSNRPGYEKVNHANGTIDRISSLIDGLVTRSVLDSTIGSESPQSRTSLLKNARTNICYMLSDSMKAQPSLIKECSTLLGLSLRESLDRGSLDQSDKVEIFERLRNSMIDYFKLRIKRDPQIETIYNETINEKDRQAWQSAKYITAAFDPKMIDFKKANLAAYDKCVNDRNDEWTEIITQAPADACRVMLIGRGHSRRHPNKVTDQLEEKGIPIIVLGMPT